MTHDRKIGIRWILVTIAVAIISRCLWLGDMEYKYDEAQTARGIARLAWSTWSPVAPVSDHSGIAHSSGCLYFLFGIAPGKEPLTIAATIAVLNTLAIILPLWLFRRTEKHFYTFALCATSLTLILGSRKIWIPDLQALWICVSIALVAASSARSKFRNLPLTALAALCLVMAGHMYLPAAFVAAVCGLAALIAYAASRRWQQFTGWLIGSTLGWATFIPWVLATLSKTPTTRANHSVAHSAAKALGQHPWLNAVRMGFTVHTPYDVYELYLRPNKGWMVQHHDSLWLRSTVIWITIASAIGLVLFAVSVYAAVRNPREVMRDPLLLTACGLLLTMPLAIFAMRLGTYIHYWLAAVPFFYYWIAWTATRGGAIWRWFTIGACVSSWLAAASFAGLVHDNKGLPGEYGSTYSSKS